MLIHIGYHKTATSWLQTHFYPNNELGVDLVARDLVADNVIRPHPLEFDAASTARLLQSACKSIQETGLKPVISNEGLSGSPHGGGYNSKDNAERLKQLFPEARILVTIREQESAVLSSYAQFVRIGGRRNLKSYVDPDVRWSGRIPYFRLEHFSYHVLIEYYQTLFGRENVLILPFEQFKKEPVAFLRKILGFYDIEPNEALLTKLPVSKKENDRSNFVGLEARRHLNILLPMDTFHPTETTSQKAKSRRDFVINTADWVARTTPTSIAERLESEAQVWLREFIGDFYAESNEILAKNCGLDLPSYGYRIAHNGDTSSSISAHAKHNHFPANERAIRQTGVGHR